MPSDQNCIEVKNYAGVLTIFTEEQRLAKSTKHPELREEPFIKRVTETITSPGFIYADLSKSKRMLYYRYEYSVNGKPKYTKVAVDEHRIPYFVVTAYRPEYVKERGKTELIFGKDND